jgi:hypothetical protein
VESFLRASTCLAESSTRMGRLLLSDAVAYLLSVPLRPL